jgi:hypothetical protein
MPIIVRRAITVLLFWACFAPVLAFSQQNIGSTALARNIVTRELSGSTAALSEGDSVYLDEGVRTGVDSTAKLVFLDSTALAVGPISHVVLDKFVYDPTPANQSVVIKLSVGVFRFTTGVLDKHAYNINTPTATVGVRGTVLDIKVESSRSRVTLVEGKALVCPRRKDETFEQQQRACGKGAPAGGRPCDCVQLENPGQTATAVKTKGGGTIASPSGAAVQFASLCGSNPSLCSGGQYAGGAPLSTASNSPGWGGGVLCGH